VSTVTLGRGICKVVALFQDIPTLVRESDRREEEEEEEEEDAEPNDSEDQRE
jgi:hypothetical protein